MSKPIDDSINSHLHYNRPMFMDQVMPKGELTLDPLCHACWYYLMLAQKNRLLVGDGPESQTILYDTQSSAEMPLWMNKQYKSIAKSVSIIYGCDSPEDFLKFIVPCLREARRLGIQFDEEICYPWKSEH